jgi:hypothetical protein
MKKLVASVLAALIMVGFVQMALAITGGSITTAPPAVPMGYFTVKFTYNGNPVVYVNKNPSWNTFWLMDGQFNFVTSGKTDANGYIKYFVPTNKTYIGAARSNTSTTYWPIGSSNVDKHVVATSPTSTSFEIPIKH